MKLSHYAERKMNLKLDWELPHYRQEAGQTALEIKHQTTVFSDPLHLWARAYQV